MKLGTCVHHPKSIPRYQRRLFKMHSFRVNPVFDFKKEKKKTLAFCNISAITKDIYLKLGVCVRYTKIYPYSYEQSP